MSDWFSGDWFSGGSGWFGGDWFGSMGTTPTGTSVLFVDTEAEVVKLTFTRRDGSGTVDYYFGLDYWPEGRLYTGSPIVYPLLASSPRVKRGVQVFAAVKYDVEIQLFGKTDFLERGKTLADALEDYQIHDAPVALYYYARASDIGGASDDAVNLRQTVRVIDQNYNDDQGILTLRCRDTWFKNKEVSKRLSSSQFTDMNLDYDGEYGPIVFGQSTIPDQGVICDAPYIESVVASNVPTAKIFSGWTFPNHPNKAFERLLVRNQHKDQDSREWVQLALPADPQTAVEGETVSSPVGDPSNWPRDVSRYARAKVLSPAEGQGHVLNVVEAHIDVISVSRCLDVLDGQHLYNSNNPDFLSKKDSDFTIEFWVNLEALDTTSNRIIVAQGDTASLSLEWVVYIPTAGPELRFAISSEGSEISQSVAWSSTVTTNVWYHVVCQHDSTNHRIGIYVNNGTVVTQDCEATATLSNPGTPGLSRDDKGIVTAKTTSAHGFHKGADLVISGADNEDSFDNDDTVDGVEDSPYEIRSISSSTQFRYKDPGTEEDSGDGTATATDRPQRLGGPFHIGSNIATDPGLDGKMKIFRYWNRLITGVEVAALYNSGTPVVFSGLTDALKKDLKCAYDFNEPTGIRADAAGSADLTPATTTGAVPADIGYDYSTASVDVTNSKGKMGLTIYHAESLDSGNTYNPKGSELRESFRDLTNAPLFLNTTRKTPFEISPPLVMAPDANYMFVLEFSNKESDDFVIRCYYDANSGSVHYAKDLRGDKQNWAKQTDTRLDMSFYYVGDGDDAWEDGTSSGTDRYSYYHLEGRTRYVLDGVTPAEFIQDLDFKIGVSGIRDDGSGSYTGSANAVIENPADLIRFALLNASFGVGSDPVSGVDTDSLSDVRAALAPLGLNQQIVVDRRMAAEEFILEIARQARIVFFKRRNGQLALHFPRAIDVDIDEHISQGVLQGELVFTSLADNDYSQVVNEFRQFYKPDTLNQPDNPALLRRDAREKYAGKLEITPDASTSGDTYREEICEASQALYGKREMTAALDHYDSATPAQKVQNYYLDRYSTLQRRIAFRVPRRSYYNALDLFDNIRVEHAGISATAGSAMPAKGHDGGTPVTAYLEGVPVLTWTGGVVKAQILEVEEEGPWITFVAETVSIF